MNKKTLIALGAFLVLLAGVMVTRMLPDGPEDLGYTIPKAMDLADGIEVVRAGESIALQKDGNTNQWSMTSPVVFRGSDTTVDSVLELFERDIEMDLRIPVSEEELGRYDLDEAKAIGLKLRAGDKVLADLLVGKTVGNRTFIKRPDENVVFRAMVNLRWKIDRDVSDWREKKLLALERESVSRLELRYPERSIVMETKGSPSAPDEVQDDDRPVAAQQWTITSPKPIEADNSAISSLLSSILNLRAADFADGVEADEGDFETSSIEVVLHRVEGEPVSIKVGGKLGEDLLDGKYADDYLVKVQGEGEATDSLYVLRDYTVQSLSKELSELRNRDMLKLVRDQVASLRVESPSGNPLVSFEKNGNLWALTAPMSQDSINMAPLNSLLSSLTNIKAARVEETDDVDLVAAGLSEKAATATLHIGMGDGQSHTIHVGSPVDSETNDHYARLEGVDDRIFLIREFLVRQITRGPETYQN